MAQIADLEKYRERRAEGEDSAKGPQVEDGYTRIANELYQVVNNAHACPVTLTQLRVIHAVIRRTYGFNKTMDALADTQIAADTGIPRQKVNPAKHQLIAMRVLVLSDDGRKIGINKRYDEWDFSARPEKKAPQRGAQPDGDTVTKKVTQDVTKSGTHKRQKDTNTSTDVEERITVEQESSKSTALPNCPHMEILDLWAEIMPDKRQHAKGMWSGSKRERNLASRWKQALKIKHEVTGKPLYTDLESGLDWWGRFFRYLRKSQFLMGDNNWFSLEWVVQRDHFDNIIEKKYHDGDQS
ncbi:replication protein [Halomonas cupida]|uniref:replication protein n=1 Tax=Halomonas cupida TaxID=44933 RepID=UPI0039B48EA8